MHIKTKSLNLYAWEIYVIFLPKGAVKGAVTHKTHFILFSSGVENNSIFDSHMLDHFTSWKILSSHARNRVGPAFSNFSLGTSPQKAGNWSRMFQLVLKHTKHTKNILNQLELWILCWNNGIFSKGIKVGPPKAPAKSKRKQRGDKQEQAGGAQCTENVYIHRYLTMQT